MGFVLRWVIDDGFQLNFEGKLADVVLGFDSVDPYLVFSLSFSHFNWQCIDWTREFCFWVPPIWVEFTINHVSRFGFCVFSAGICDLANFNCYELAG